MERLGGPTRLAAHVLGRRPTDLEVAVLARSYGRRAFRRVEGDELISTLS